MTFAVVAASVVVVPIARTSLANLSILVSQQVVKLEMEGCHGREFLQKLSQ